MDHILDDPGELIRFWLWFQKHHAMRHLVIADLARFLKLKQATVGAWLGRHAISSQYWTPIARYFGRQTHRDIEDEATQLWQEPQNRNGYVPLYQIQIKRRRARRAHRRTGEPAAEATLEGRWRSGQAVQ